MAKTTKCKECTNLKHRKTLEETSRGSGEYTVISSHYYCPVKKTELTGHDVLRNSCAAGEMRG